MSLNEETAWILRSGTYLGLTIMVIGLLCSSFDFSDIILTAGIVVLIFTPVAGILVSTKCLIKEKDRAWTRVAFILMLVLLAGALISWFS